MPCCRLPGLQLHCTAACHLPCPLSAAGPQHSACLQMRAVLCVLLILVMRVLNLAVPILYKELVDLFADVTNKTHRDEPQHFTFKHVGSPEYCTTCCLCLPMPSGTCNAGLTELEPPGASMLGVCRVLEHQPADMFRPRLFSPAGLLSHCGAVHGGCLSARGCWHRQHGRHQQHSPVPLDPHPAGCLQVSCGSACLLATQAELAGQGWSWPA